jgi:Family of unknown function (DUF6527)
MRKTRLIDLEPKWVYHRTPFSGPPDAVRFECPEADGGCGSHHVIPVSPAKDGSATEARHWDRHGDDFATMTISPSIRCAGACRMHVTVVRGEILFADDSKSGPDWSA